MEKRQKNQCQNNNPYAFLNLGKITSFFGLTNFLIFTIASSIDGQNLDTDNKEIFYFFKFFASFLKSFSSNNGAVG